MDIQESVMSLRNQFSDKDWFSNVTTDEFNRIVVLVSSMKSDVVRSIPDSFNGRQVLVHFDPTNLVKKESFVTVAGTPSVTVTDPAPPPVIEEDFEEDALPIDVLTKELDHLEKLCGSNILQDIFFEVHDGPNAVTNLSSKFPEIRDSMKNLYKIFGFDVIYEELDG